MFVVNFDALAQASDIRIERRVAFLCWMQDSNPGSQNTKSPAVRTYIHRFPWLQHTQYTRFRHWTARTANMLPSLHSTHSTCLYDLQHSLFTSCRPCIAITLLALPSLHSTHSTYVSVITHTLMSPNKTHYTRLRHCTALVMHVSAIAQHSPC